VKHIEYISIEVRWYPSGDEEQDQFYRDRLQEFIGNAFAQSWPGSDRGGSCSGEITVFEVTQTDV
jgi:hypothetical protein